jgi:hypothetical protein
VARCLVSRKTTFSYMYSVTPIAVMVGLFSII